MYLTAASPTPFGTAVCVYGGVCVCVFVTLAYASAMNGAQDEDHSDRPALDSRVQRQLKFL